MTHYTRKLVLMLNDEAPSSYLSFPVFLLKGKRLTPALSGARRSPGPSRSATRARPLENVVRQQADLTLGTLHSVT